MQELILIKLGGSVITDKSKRFFAKEDVIRRLGKEIAEADKGYRGKIVVGHGSGSFGHIVAAKYKTHKGLTGKDSLQGLVLTADAAAQINRIVTANLLKSGLKVVSFAPASFILAKGQQTDRIFSDPIRHFLETGGIPVIFGDVVMDQERGFCIFSAEKVLNSLVEELVRDYKVLRIIHCGRTDGVYDSERGTIPKITPKNFRELKKEISGSEGVDVTGGMLHKVEESLAMASKHKIKTVIINGNAPGQLKKAILGKRVKSTTVEG